MAVKCMNMIDNNAALHKAVVELFADTKIEVTSDMEIRDFPPGYEIEMGSILTTGDFNVAVMGSDGIWKWEENSSSKTAFNGELVYDGTILEGYKVSVKVPSGITKIGDNAFKNLTGLENVNITEGVALIGDYAFYGCTGLKTVKIASTVTGIGDSAFEGCTGLETVYCEPATPPSLGTDAFDGIASSCVIYVSDASYMAYATSWSDMTDYLLPAGGTVEATVTGNPISMSDAVAHNAISTILSYSPKQSGSGDPSPYNICPIDGWTGANITRAGKNLFHAQNDTKVGVTLTVLSDGGIKLQGLCTANYIFSVPAMIIPTATYTISCGLSGNLPNDTAFIAQALVGSSDAFFTVTNRDATNTSFKVSAIRGGSVTFRIRVEKDYDYDCIIYPQFEVGTNATAYTPYETPTVYPDTWQSEVGIVYGGVRNLTTGTLTVTHIISVIDENRGFRFFEGNKVWRTNPLQEDFEVAGAPDVICNQYRKSQNRGSAAAVASNNADLTFCTLTSSTSNKTIYVHDERFVNEDDPVTALKAWLAENPIYYVQELATPITYTLTPTEITLLAGANTIWTDGDEVTLTYLAVASQHQEPTPLLGLTSLSRGISNEEENPDTIEEPIEEEFIENLEENPEEDIIDTPVEEETTENDER